MSQRGSSRRAKEKDGPDPDQSSKLTEKRPVGRGACAAKRSDLEFFLREICEMDYVHVPELAPTQEMLGEYRKAKGDWAAYERKFLDLMRKRKIERTVDRAVIADGCLLCSEDKPHHCHRRLVAEYLESHWGDVEIAHIG